MPWTTPLSWQPGQVVAASDLNVQIRDNLFYLLAGRVLAQAQHVGLADYTTTSTAFVDADATNLALTLTINSGRALLIAMVLASGTLTNGGAYLSWNVDSGVALGSPYGLLSTALPGVGGQLHALTVIGAFTGLSVGAHLFKLQYRGNGTGGATIYNTSLPITLLGLEI